MACDSYSNNGSANVVFSMSTLPGGFCPSGYQALFDAVAQYLVGTPKGRLSKLEAQLADRPWHQVREGITVKLLPQEGEVYVLAQSKDRVNKERSMRRRHSPTAASRRK